MIVNGFKTKAAALRYLKEQGHKFSGLLARPESNPKVAKNGKLDVLAAPLHLAPFDLSGFQVCPMASQGCAAAFLHTAGNPAYMAGKDASRKDKTRAYFKHRDAFMAVLFFEIEALRTKARKLGMKPAVRLNATSDLPWEIRKVTINAAPYAGSLNLRADTREVGLMEWFSDVQFYDYTAITKRAVAWGEGRMPANYHLTFSRKEDNDAACIDVLKAGGNVSVVFSKEAYAEAQANGVQVSNGALVLAGGPQTADFTAFDGDATDYRPADPKGVIVALKAKGDAKGDTSGFVLR